VVREVKVKTVVVVSVRGFSKDENLMAGGVGEGFYV
jgi:hypothetical protein